MRYPTCARCASLQLDWLEAEDIEAARRWGTAAADDAGRPDGAGKGRPGRPGELAEPGPEADGRPYDLIVGTDVVFAERLVPPPAPPRTPTPPTWRSRWVQVRTRRERS